MRKQTVVLGMTMVFVAALPAGRTDAQPAETGGPAAEGAQKTPPPPPNPAPQNDVIKPARGSWRCEGVLKAPDGNEMKYRSRWVVKPTLGGHWYSINYRRAKSGPMPGFAGLATVGYNVVDSKYWFVGFDDMGGWINLVSTDGSVFSGESAMGAEREPATFTFVPGTDKKGQESDRLFEVTMDFGQASSKESCRR